MDYILMVIYVPLPGAGEARLSSVEPLLLTENAQAVGNLNTWSHERIPTHQDIALAEKFRSEAESK